VPQQAKAGSSIPTGPRDPAVAMAVKVHSLIAVRPEAAGCRVVFQVTKIDFCYLTA
jgi:hypothetical protein